MVRDEHRADERDGQPVVCVEVGRRYPTTQVRAYPFDIS
jgi:hypothetical protein